MTTKLFINMVTTGIVSIITLYPVMYMCTVCYGFLAYHMAVPVISWNTLGLLITLYSIWIVVLGGFLGFALTKSEDK